MSNFFAVILAGGEGTRFAPLSTSEKPKQFLSILDPDFTLIQQTFNRLKGVVPSRHCFVSTSARYVDIVQQQLALTCDQIIGEPLKKNTAPAIALITWYLFLKNPSAVILFCPSDHYIHHVSLAQDIWKKAFREVQESLCVFGVNPSFPSADYGYIRQGQPVGSDFYQVASFVEKPDRARAESYLKEGNYLWNSGMFLWKAKVFLAVLQQTLPMMYRLLQDVKLSPDGCSLDSQSMNTYFEKVESISVDYGVMEKAKNVVVTPFDVGWSDVGTWQGLRALKEKYNLKLSDEVEEQLMCHPVLDTGSG